MVAAGHQVCVPQALVARVKVSVGESVPMLEVATVQEALDVSTRQHHELLVPQSRVNVAATGESIRSA